MNTRLINITIYTSMTHILLYIYIPIDLVIDLAGNIAKDIVIDLAFLYYYGLRLGLGLVYSFGYCYKCHQIIIDIIS